MNNETHSIDLVTTYLQNLQSSITNTLNELDKKETFVTDKWDRPEGGGGESRILKNGAIFEQAGVSFSHIHGDELPPSATKSRPELAGKKFQAMGISLVIHPLNPYIPNYTCQFKIFYSKRY